MTGRETPQVIGVRPVGLSAWDPAALAEFYRDVLGLQIVPVDTSALGATAFLSSRPAEVPVDLALFANPAYQHTAFEVRSLADLRALHQRVLGRGVPVKMALNHGVSLSFYFDDPEGHLIKVYWPTGVACRPCHGDPINLTLSEEALRRHLADWEPERALRLRQTARNRGGRNRGRRSQQPKRTDGRHDACYRLCPGAFYSSVRSTGASSARRFCAGWRAPI